MKDTLAPHLEFSLAREELGRLGVLLEIVPGEYRARIPGEALDKTYCTEDLADAVTVGRAMAEEAKAKLSPMGPTGRRNSRKASMYRHNTLLAARRRRVRP